MCKQTSPVHTRSNSSVTNTNTEGLRQRRTEQQQQREAVPQPQPQQTGQSQSNQQPHFDMNAWMSALQQQYQMGQNTTDNVSHDQVRLTTV